MKVFSATDIGQKRTMNQDFVFASASPVGNLPNLFVVGGICKKGYEFQPGADYSAWN